MKNGESSSPARIERLAPWLFGGLLAFGVFLHVVEVWRPIDGSSRSAWREADVGMIARNFWRGDMNILRPQIDWRRDGPGFVESEFPLLPWVMAAGYRAFGYREEIGRVLAALISLASLWVFHRLARRLLAPWPGRLALLLFVFNPTMVHASTSLQPDGGMLLCMLLAMDRWLEWRETNRAADLLLGALATALAVAVKGPAVCLGPILAAFVLEKHGTSCLRRREIWLAGAVMILPPAAWYLHAHGFWVRYGNSLGVTNQHHWIGLDMLRDPAHLAERMLSTARLELRYVFCFYGALAALLGLLRLSRQTRPVLYWAGGVALFYLLALRTVAEPWFFYYHILAVPPACLLMALSGPSRRDAGAGWSRLPVRLRRGAGLVAAVVSLFALGASVRMGTSVVDFAPPGRGEGPEGWARYEAAHTFSPLIEPDALVVTLSDNPVADARGVPVAHDDGRMLFWLDRRGFTMAMEEQSVEALTGFQRRGAKYFACNRSFPAARELQSRFEVVARSGDWFLGRL